MAEKSPIILSVVPAGTPLAPRYRVADQFMRFWTGEKWSEPKAEHEGLLYANSNDACLEVQRLLMLEYMDRKHRRYRAPVYLELFSDQDIPKDELVRWCVRAAKLIMNNDAYGNGPLEGTLGLLKVEWSELEQVKE